MGATKEKRVLRKKRRAVWIGLLIGVLVIVIAVIGVISGAGGTFQPMAYGLTVAYEAEAYTLTFENGDTVYTPASSHITLDPDRTIMYYNNLLLAFTRQDLTEQEISELAQKVNGKAVGRISGAIHAVQVLVKESTLDALEMMADTLMKEDTVIYAYSDYPVQIMGDAGLNESVTPVGGDWWIQAIGADVAWEYSNRCQPAKAGVLDSGFSVDHEDLKGHIVPVGAGSNDSMDDHGIHVAGIIGGLNNGIGIRGICDNIQIYCADLWHEEHADSFHTLAEYLAAVNSMVQSGVRAFNNSWGCVTLSSNVYQTTYPAESKFLDGISKQKGHELWLDQRMNQDLIPTAEASIAMIGQMIASGYGDILIVQAAGNGYADNGEAIEAVHGGFFSRITEPVFAALPDSLAAELAALDITYEDIDERILIVGAADAVTDKNGNYLLTGFSNFGESVDICAPGSNIYSTVSSASGLYESYDGTSMAAPMVTGSAAFIWSLKPELSAPEVRAILLENTMVQAIGIGNSEGWSYPMLNLGCAVEHVMGMDNTP